MLMSAIDSAVDAVPLIVVVLTERFEQTGYRRRGNASNALKPAENVRRPAS
jgi:hypothetical protein